MVRARRVGQGKNDGVTAAGKEARTFSLGCIEMDTVGKNAVFKGNYQLCGTN